MQAMMSTTLVRVSSTHNQAAPWVSVLVQQGPAVVRRQLVRVYQRQQLRLPLFRVRAEYLDLGYRVLVHELLHHGKS